MDVAKYVDLQEDSYMAILFRKLAERPRSVPSLVGPDDQWLRSKIILAWERFHKSHAEGQKEYLRELHRVAKTAAQGVDAEELLSKLDKLSDYFRSGCDIDPHKIAPRLISVERRSKWEDLFKICRASWSMPYSKGYGRRLRFIVFDEYHGAVMGVIGLQSPAADLSCRDQLLQFEEGRKMDIVNCMLDAYTIGAVPPYTDLLGGKLVASLVASDELRQAYWRQYAGKRTVMAGRKLAQPLLAVTTTSVYGRSSIYNRLRYHGRLLAEPIGWTKGFGTVHLEGLYPQIEAWLKARGELIPGGFGNGPKVRWQNISTALNRLGLPQKYAEHGISRQVFLFRHVNNLEAVCRFGAPPQPIMCKAEALSDYWMQRWALPRAARDAAWKSSTPLPLLRNAIRELIPEG